MQHLMEELLSGSALAQLEEGQIVRGTITEVRQGEVMVNIGAKSDGKVRLSEFEDQSEVQPGQEIDVFLARLEDQNGSPVLCYDRARQQKNWERLSNSVEEGSIVTGRVKGKTRGGLVVSIGVDAFLPSSQLDIKPVKNVDEYIGRTFEFKVVKINYERRNIVLSRRELLEEDRWRKSRQIFENLKPGDIVSGFVKNITDYGAFVDLDGVDGLLHVTDMSWGRVTHPNQVLRAGEELSVMVLDIDREKERISLGLKQTMPNPWDSIEQRYPIGACVKGKVVNLVPYGAFVELEDGVEGLVHVTEISWTRKIAKPSDVLKIGQEVEAVVIGIQKDEQKIALGLRQLEENPWDKIAHKYPVGTIVHGKVQSMTNYGAFLELEPGVNGMVHVSDVSWNRKIKNLEDSFKVGDDVEAVVLSVDQDGHRISLGVKQLADNPWLHIHETFHVGDRVTGKVVKITSFGAFVELAKGVDGIIHASQIQDEHVDKVRDVLSVGQEVTARIIKVDPSNERISLSIKALDYDESELQKEVDSMQDGATSSSEFGTIGYLFDRASS
ncbi:MAG: 30S ribosomal protein S1 [Puniceicoccales bacterium]|jgi:small subunit ribosomal protein S1|nr:30S ribosomal protein S1 [Puniceicoccales bacterium]